MYIFVYLTWYSCCIYFKGINLINPLKFCSTGSRKVFTLQAQSYVAIGVNAKWQNDKLRQLRCLQQAACYVQRATCHMQQSWISRSLSLWRSWANFRFVLVAFNGFCWKLAQLNFDLFHSLYLWHSHSLSLSRSIGCSIH